MKTLLHNYKRIRLFLFLLKRYPVTLPNLLFLFFILSSNAQHTNLTPTPPMGWNAWNVFNTDIDEEKIRGIADAMVTSGMKDAGYQYVVIDDQWHKGRISGSPHEYSRHPKDIPGRDAHGRLLVDETKFPSGMKALGDYIHSKGLKFGIYSSPGRKTCTYCPGSEGYEAIDISTFADWGVDFIKLDWCEWVKDDYSVVLRRWRKLLDESERPMVLSVNFHRGDDFSEHRKAANMFRTTTDIMKVWSFKPEEFRVQASVVDIIDRQEGLEEYHGQGAWCDPDMMQVGNEPFRYEENKSHFSMWAIFGAPLIAGNDLRTMSYQTRDILTNKEVIAINQDAAGTKGIKVAEFKPGLEIYVKRLQQFGAQAIALYNRTDEEKVVKVSWKDIGIKGEAFVRDLWQHEDKGLFKDGYATKVPAHGTAILKVNAYEYLEPLPDNRIELSEIPSQGLMLECENHPFLWLCGRIDTTEEGYSGTGYLKGENSWWNLTAIWRVSLVEAKKYSLTFRYQNRMNKDLVFAFNKSEESVILKKGKGWQETTVIGNLKEGINWIELLSPDKNSNEVYFDYMRLSKMD